ncbi:hypothetical protein AbraIFM66951_005661 [Aspergillus brasiliensis]|uniref:BTB domain-containing protein n=1 Tax=Aspergillus brasiliensis TaxID=319629 RepID=A0A9W6DMA6_9EURO|nr:hypothetical protein AbraCBS73388_008658 [Aspergillus brasiliensis]GKZ51410.1 hypothetical protein AbraIFM66951_005661 [Aspergillus brasiliensis]
MESDRDFSSAATDHALDGYSIVHSPPFTFLVGPNHTKLTIQSGLARHVSQPLDHLMNSGETRESKHHIAVLEEYDVETFVAFCEYAYTGDYRVPPPGSREEDREEQAVTNPFRGVFSNDPSSPAAIPPRAPTPPGRPVDQPHGDDHDKSLDDGWSRADEEHRPARVEHSFPGKDDDWECAIADDEPQEPAPATKEASEQPPPTPAAEQGDGDGWDAIGDDASKGKKGKKNKKDKKKKKGGAAAEEAAPNLTPPSTPPPQNSKPEEEAANPASETNAVSEDATPAPETVEAPPVSEPADTAAPASSPTESWEHTAPTPPDDGADVPGKEDNKEQKEETQQESEESRDHQEATTRRPTGPMIDTSFARQQYSRMNEKGTSLWDEFAAIDYVDPRSCSVTRPPSVMSARSPLELPYLVFHAKLYVFATRYLIPALAQLCLRKLHRDLLYLGFAESSIEGEDEEQHGLNTTKARKILDLLHYTYTKTTRLEPITPTSATQLRDNELRKLVVHFAACKVRDLAAYSPPVESDLGSPSSQARKPSARGFRALLDTTTELASDLVYRMMM